MEPVTQPIKVAYTIIAKVTKLGEHFTKEWLKGSGAEAEFTERSLGWFAMFEGSFEMLYFGETKPEFDTGNKVKITFTKEPT